MNRFSVGILSLACVISIVFAATVVSADDLIARLSNSARSDADKARDAGRKPAEVIEFLGIEPGMTVIDLVAASGWYTEVLALAVGPTGKVYAQNPAFVLRYRDGANDKAMTARLEGGRLANVIRLDREMGELGLEAGSFDAAFTALNFHDIYNGSGAEGASGFLTAVRGLLEPGGVLGIIDHVGMPGADNQKLHRVEAATVEELAKAAGFIVESRGDFLKNPADDHTLFVFDKAIRGQTDRFILKLRKPDGR